MNQEKIQGAAQLFPEIFIANKNKFFKMYMETYGDNSDNFDIPEAPQMDPVAALMGGQTEPQPITA